MMPSEMDGKIWLVDIISSMVNLFLIAYAPSVIISVALGGQDMHTDDPVVQRIYSDLYDAFCFADYTSLGKVLQREYPA